MAATEQHSQSQGHFGSLRCPASMGLGVQGAVRAEPGQQSHSGPGDVPRHVLRCSATQLGWGGGGWLGAGSDCGEQSQRASLPYVPLSSLFSLFCPVIKLSAHTIYLSSPSTLKAYVSPGLCGAALPTGIGQGRWL